MRPLLGQGEDPDETFRGEIQANQTLVNYGVHARGIVRLVELLRAERHIPADFSAHLLRDLDSIKLAISLGHPVIAWLPLGLRASSRVPTPLPSGKVVNLVYAEHTVTLRGYDGTYFYALEPYNGSAPRYEAWALWHGMTLFDDPAVVISPGPGAVALPEVAAPAPMSVPVPALPASRHFAETGVTLEGGFYHVFTEHGGRDALGLPLTPELSEMDAHSGATKQVVYTELTRLEWYPASGEFGIGFVGQDLLDLQGPPAQPDPARRLGGAIARYVEQHGGVGRFGYSLSEEVPIQPADADLLPYAIPDAVGQWFQTGLLIWSPSHNLVVPARVGLALARARGLI